MSKMLFPGTERRYICNDDLQEDFHVVKFSLYVLFTPMFTIL